MPLYRYKCGNGHRFEAFAEIKERHMQVCHCGKAGILVPVAPSVITFRGGWFEHVGPEPVYCDTPDELRKACKDNDARSAYLENSIFGGSDGQKEI